MRTLDVWQKNQKSLLWIAVPGLQEGDCDCVFRVFFLVSKKIILTVFRVFFMVSKKMIVTVFMVFFLVSKTMIVTVFWGSSSGSRKRWLWLFFQGLLPGLQIDDCVFRVFFPGIRRWLWLFYQGLLPGLLEDDCDCVFKVFLLVSKKMIVTVFRVFFLVSKKMIVTVFRVFFLVSKKMIVTVFRVFFLVS